MLTFWKLHPSRASIPSPQPQTRRTARELESGGEWFIGGTDGARTINLAPTSTCVCVFFFCIDSVPYPRLRVSVSPPEPELYPCNSGSEMWRYILPSDCSQCASEKAKMYIIFSGHFTRTLFIVECCLDLCSAPPPLLTRPRHTSVGPAQLLQRGDDENVSTVMDVNGCPHCSRVLRGFGRGEVGGLCYSQSRQPLVSTWSPGIVTWGTISAVFLLSTVCILWSFSLCCCMTTNPVTVEHQHPFSIEHAPLPRKK